MKRDYETLDAIVVVACLAMVSGLGAALVLVKGIPTEHLPVISSLVTAIFGLPGMYGAFRWGNNVGAKNTAEAAAETSKTATGALAQIAGASPPVIPSSTDQEEPKP